MDVGHNVVFLLSFIWYFQIYGSLIKGPLYGWISLEKMLWLKELY